MSGKSVKMIPYRILTRCLHTSTVRCIQIETKLKFDENFKVKQWELIEYGNVDKLRLKEVSLPIIESPRQVLVQVEAASVNPIDTLMMSGYGTTLLGLRRGCSSAFPLVLGRDFSGTIIKKGQGVGEQLSIGTKIYGFIPLEKNGSFSSVVLVDQAHIAIKPDHLTAMEASSLVYTTMTAWSALFLTGNLQFKSCSGVRVLVLGASGGVGTAAIQLLNAHGCEIVATCALDAMPLVESLGAHKVINYKEPNYFEKVALGGDFNIILDCAKLGPNQIPSSVKCGTYIGLNSPLLKNTDKNGIIGGLAQSAGTLLVENMKDLNRSVKWGFFVPSSTGFRLIHKLIKENKIKPVIQKEFPFETLPEALKFVENGHLRGKVVVAY